MTQIEEIFTDKKIRHLTSIRCLTYPNLVGSNIPIVSLLSFLYNDTNDGGFEIDDTTCKHIIFLLCENYWDMKKANRLYIFVLYLTFLNYDFKQVERIRLLNIFMWDNETAIY